jgi:hypothetical protein
MQRITRKKEHNKIYTQNPQYGVLFGSTTVMVVCQQGILYIKFIPLLRGLHSPSFKLQYHHCNHTYSVYEMKFNTMDYKK